MTAAFFLFSSVFLPAGDPVRDRSFSLVSGNGILLFLYGEICDIIAVARDARRCFTAFFDKSGSRPPVQAGCTEQCPVAAGCRVSENHFQRTKENGGRGRNVQHSQNQEQKEEKRSEGQL